MTGTREGDVPPVNVHPALATPPPYPERGRGILDGAAVVVTAAAGTGIGSATAKRCLEEGAGVVISDAHERRLGETVTSLSEQYGNRVQGVVCDVTDEAAVVNLLDSARQALGPLDVVVNNAGLGDTRAIVDTTDEQWARVLDVTLTGTFRSTRAAMRIFAQQESGGMIVNNASVLGWRAQAGQAAYAAAKAGVMALTRCAAAEGAELGVRVNAVAPSLAPHRHLAKSAPAELLDELAERELFGRGAEPWEVANVIVFLASPYSSYLSGEVVPVSSQRA